MNRDAVSSTNVASIGYDAATLTLEVEFRTGNVYQYFDVPETAYRELMSGASIGKYINTVIKQSYRYARV